VWAAALNPCPRRRFAARNPLRHLELWKAIGSSHFATRTPKGEGHVNEPNSHGNGVGPALRRIDIPSHVGPLIASNVSSALLDGIRVAQRESNGQTELSVGFLLPLSFIFLLLFPILKLPLSFHFLSHSFKVELALIPTDNQTVLECRNHLGF
jgi:hypothetical protein